MEHKSITRYIEFLCLNDKLSQEVQNDLYCFCSKITILIGDNFQYDYHHAKIMYDGYKEEYLNKGKLFCE